MKNTNKKVESEYVTKSEFKTEMGLVNSNILEMKESIDKLTNFVGESFAYIGERLSGMDKGLDRVEIKLETMDVRLSNVESDMENVATKNDIKNLNNKFVSQYNFDLLKARVSILEENPDNA